MYETRVTRAKAIVSLSVMDTFYIPPVYNITTKLCDIKYIYTFMTDGVGIVIEFCIAVEVFTIQISTRYIYLDTTSHWSSCLVLKAISLVCAFTHTVRH